PGGAVTQADAPGERAVRPLLREGRAVGQPEERAGGRLLGPAQQPGVRAESLIRKRFLAMAQSAQSKDKSFSSFASLAPLREPLFSRDFPISAPFLSRRDWLKLSAAGALGSSVSGWFGDLAQAAAFPVRPKKSCILLWMSGGPSQLDTFDLK